MATTVYETGIELGDLKIGGRGRLRVRVFRTEYAYKVNWRSTLFEVRVLRKEILYLQSSLSSDLKVAISLSELTTVGKICQLTF